MEIKRDVLEARLASFVNLYNKNEYPIKVIMLGFGSIEINNEEELWWRIWELCDIVRKKMIIKETNVERDGFKIKIKKLTVEEK